MSRIYICAVLILFACVGTACKWFINDRKGNGVDSITQEREDSYDGDRSDSLLIKKDEDYRVVKYTYYNSKDTSIIDSVRQYYKGTKILEGVEYKSGFGADKWIYAIRYRETGELAYLIYEYENPKIGDTIMIDWRPNGSIWTIKRYARDSIDYPVLYESFHENGILAEKGIKDVYRGAFFRHGLWHCYDTTGVLIKTENYIFPKEEDPYIIEINYCKNGNLKSEKQYYLDFEESGVTINRGTWKYYDEHGNVIKTEKY